MHSVSITHTFHSDWCTIMLMTLLTYSEEVQQMWKYLEWMLRASASSHPESPWWAPCQFNHTASWHPAGKPCHVLILTMVDQSKANRKSSTKVTREAKMLLLVQFWQTGETFYLPSKFLGRGKWCREYWEDSQKYIVFIFRLKAKIIREDLCCRTWGFYVGCCISLLGRESMNCQFKWNSSQIKREKPDIIQSSPHSRCSWSSHVVTKDCPMLKLFPNINL